ncbi:Uncharacterised protein [Mycobacteroides abscessus subsp. massiliense]|jgi:hypothetical protein|nr:Uncharacterised protein [Mycobacteroides abscessus subsp. massiliense]
MDHYSPDLPHLTSGARLAPSIHDTQPFAKPKPKGVFQPLWVTHQFHSNTSTYQRSNSA